MNKGKVSGVSWVKPAEPSFLKKFKDDVGFKEGPTVDTKRQATPTLDDDSDQEDERPQVVTLQAGDLTAEEVQQMKAPGGASQDSEAPPNGKILFKKPAKGSSEKFQGIRASSSSKRKSDGLDREHGKDERVGKKIKNQSLLSFGGQDEEEEEQEEGQEEGP